MNWWVPFKWYFWWLAGYPLSGTFDDLLEANCGLAWEWETPEGQSLGGGCGFHSFMVLISKETDEVLTVKNKKRSPPGEGRRRRIIFVKYTLWWIQHIQHPTKKLRSMTKGKKKVQKDKVSVRTILRYWNMKHVITVRKETWNNNMLKVLMEKVDNMQEHRYNVCREILRNN